MLKFICVCNFIYLFLKNAFDHAEAQKEGSILPKEGIDSEYDEVMLSFNDIQRSLDKYLKEQSEYFGCKVTVICCFVVYYMFL